MNPCNLNQLGINRETPWAVGHFNIHNHEFIRAVVRAAEQERSPAILAVGMMSIKYMGLAPLISSCQIICTSAGRRVRGEPLRRPFPELCRLPSAR